MPHIIEGQMTAQGLKVAIVATRFNDFVVSHLVSGDMAFLTRHGMNADDATIIRVPGAFELRIADFSLLWSSLAAIVSAQ